MESDGDEWFSCPHFTPPLELVFNQRGVTLASVGQAVLLRLLESPEHHAAAVQVGEGGRKVHSLGGRYHLFQQDIHRSTFMVDLGNMNHQSKANG